MKNISKKICNSLTGILKISVINKPDSALINKIYEFIDKIKNIKDNCELYDSSW